jgi:parvulin-like peptidyl-prolyl isomerase
MRILSLLLAAPLITACATAGSPPLARVNGDPITGADLKREFARHHMALDRIIGDEAEVRRYLEKVIDRRLLLQEGRRMGIQDRPEVARLVEAHRGEKLQQILLKTEVDDKGIASDEAVKAIYDQYQDALEVRQIVVATEPEAVQLREQLAAGADFEKLARERSRSPSAVQGGLGMVTWGADPEREKIVFALKEGELSAPWKSEQGWEIDRLEHRVPPKEMPPYVKLAPRIRTVLERRARVDLHAALLDGLRKKYDAQTLDCPIHAAELKSARQPADDAARALAERVCATWTGGALTLRQIADRVVVEELEKVPAERREEVERQALRDLLDERILVAEALARGYDKRPEVVEEVAAKEDDAIEDVLLSQHVLAGVSATDEEVKAWYDAHPGDFVEPARYRLAQIVVDSPEKAAEAQGRLATGESFEEVAKGLSKDARTAVRGGFVGEFGAPELRKRFEPVLSLKAGEVSAPIASPNGLHIVKVLSVIPERKIPYDEAMPAARRAVLKPRVDERSKKWLGTLRAAARIEVSDEGIRAYSRQKTEQLKAAEAEAAAKKAKGETRHGGEMSTGLGEAPAKAPAKAPAAGQAPVGVPAPAPGAEPATVAPPAAGAPAAPAQAPASP